MSVSRRSYSTDLTDAEEQILEPFLPAEKPGDGTWLKIQDYQPEQLREQMQRDKQPSAAIVDSQSVKTTEKGRRREVTMEAKR